MSGPTGEAASVADLTARRRHRDGDLWCLYCREWILWRATAERYEHETTSNPKCAPLDPTSTRLATPAPEDQPLPRTGGRAT